LTKYLGDIVTDEGLWHIALALSAAKEGRSTFDMLTTEWLDRTSPLVAAWLLEKFDPEYLSRASWGGKHHRPRQPTIYGAMLRPFADLPAKELAHKLGIALSTVYKVRKRSAEWDARPKEDLAPLDWLSDLD
jgi:hypothetical protein